MSRKVWVTRDAQGNVITSTAVRSSSGCSGCLWVLLGIFVIVGPAAWAENGDIPIGVAVLMYMVEGAIAVTLIAQHARRRATHQPHEGPPMQSREVDDQAPPGRGVSSK